MPAAVVRPASATLDRSILLDLLRLHIERAPFEDGVVALDLTLEVERSSPRQGSLLSRPRRDVAGHEVPVRGVKGLVRQ